MNTKSLRQETEFAHTRHIAVAPAIRKRKSHLSNIWIFDSPKNNRRFIVEGDVAFMHFVLMEGDLTISRYDPDPVPVMASIDGEIRQTKLDAIVYFVDGHTEWWEFKRSEDAGPDRTGRARPQLSAQAQAANHVGVPYRVKTEIDLRGNEIQFDNWLLLCAAMTRSRNQPMHHEARILESRLNMHEAVAIGALLEEPEADPGLMLAIIAKSLQRGFIHTELIKDLITRNSIVSRSSK